MNSSNTRARVLSGWTDANGVESRLRDNRQREAELKTQLHNESRVLARAEDHMKIGVLKAEIRGEENIEAARNRYGQGSGLHLKLGHHEYSTGVRSASLVTGGGGGGGTSGATQEDMNSLGLNGRMSNRNKARYFPMTGGTAGRRGLFDEDDGTGTSTEALLSMRRR